ncbi:hypothetical protein [Halomicrobium salinisoli]|uniref:hypothetical protein n=1 Tax=Halomicrobium salinisoli TaxID=2878391 RepID=UPI001CEFC611|nr:hypothetical protein [Halomicrobium salinisoli]
MGIVIEQRSPESNLLMLNKIVKSSSVSICLSSEVAQVHGFGALDDGLQITSESITVGALSSMQAAFSASAGQRNHLHTLQSRPVGKPTVQH